MSANWAGKRISTDGRCGPNFGNTACGGKACCSAHGWCGGSTGQKDDWCGTNTFNGEYNGERLPANWAGKIISTDGRCGPNFGNTACGGKACCSAHGWCGGSTGQKDDWCGTNTFNGEYNGERPPPPPPPPPTTTRPPTTNTASGSSNMILIVVIIFIIISLLSCSSSGAGLFLYMRKKLI